MLMQIAVGKISNVFRRDNDEMNEENFNNEYIEH